MISVLVPTRGRPQNVLRMVRSALATAAFPAEVEIVLRADSDDPDAVPAGVQALGNVKVVTAARAVLSSLWNDACLHASGEIYMQCDDEVIFRTAGWDVLVEDVFGRYPDRIVFVHGQDLFQPAGTFGTLGFLHRRWTDAVGYFTPPYFSCDYGDTWLNDVANMIGRRQYVEELVTEHCHPVAGKAEWDVTHMERLARGQADGVVNLYDSYAWKRAEDADKLRAVMGLGVPGLDDPDPYPGPPPGPAAGVAGRPDAAG